MDDIPKNATITSLIEAEGNALTASDSDTNSSLKKKDSNRLSQTKSNAEILPNNAAETSSTSSTAPVAEFAEVAPPVVPVDAPSPEALKRDISMRQMVLMAAGGSIGAGLFVGSGQALSSGGPGSLVLNYAICGLMVSMTMASLGEMATSYPVAGAFYDYTVRFVGLPWGFAMGWNFVFNWLIVLPFELTTIGAQIAYWDQGVRNWYIVVAFLVFLGFVAYKGAAWFGELEHWLGLCKAVALCTFICFAIALTASGIPGDDRGAIGARYWKSPGAFLNGFQGFLAVFRVAGMSYGGTEMLGLTAAECRRPHRMMPIATKIVFFRLIFFYVGGLLMLGFVVPADSTELASVGHGAKYSPFVLAANLANQPQLANFFNAMIVIALISMANAAIFASSRALHALCMKGMGPKRWARTPRGVPMYCLGVAFVLALIAFVSDAPGGTEIFDWLLSLSAVSNYFTWMAICYSHIRMRKAMVVQGRSLDNIIWRSPFGLWGSYIGLVVCALGLLAQVVVAAWPIGGYDAKVIIRDVIGIPVIFIFFGGYIFWRRYKHNDGRLLVPLGEIDLDFGFRDKRFAKLADEEADVEKRAERRALGYQEDWSPTKKAIFLLKTRFDRPSFGLPSWAQNLAARSRKE